MFSHQSMIVLLTALYTELSWGLPTSLFILLCHSVTAWSISSSYVSSKRGLKYLSYDLKYPHTRFFIWPYEHQSYSYSPRPRIVRRQNNSFYVLNCHPAGHRGPADGVRGEVRDPVRRAAPLGRRLGGGPRPNHPLPPPGVQFNKHLRFRNGFGTTSAHNSKHD